MLMRFERVGAPYHQHKAKLSRVEVHKATDFSPSQPQNSIMS